MTLSTTIKRTLFSFGLGMVMLVSSASLSFAQDSHNHKDGRSCSTDHNLERLLSINPDAKENMDKVETFTAQYIQNLQSQREEATVYRIPVVVHVIYNTTAQNISQAQIQSQIDVLNEDFRRTNSDYTLTPSEFAGSVADSEIEFFLATTDPAGNPTTGVTRTSTTKTSFTTNDDMKFNSRGGKDAWNTQKYMNMWVCNMSGGILGYAQFPGSGAANTDGVVMLTTGFGSTGNVGAPFDLGRTATHEVGHWLNLRHIWGDGGCSADDFVTDTPLAAASNGGCPSYPSKSCSSNGGFTSDMFMNYMDYTNDACMYMFTTGQKNRMRAVLATGGFRAALSTTTTTPPPASCGVPSGLASSAVTSSTFTTSWSAVSGAASYDLQVRTGSGAWTTLNSATNSLSLSGASAATQYEYQVRANCSGASSAYSTSRFVTTSGTTTVSYCVSKGNNVADEWINRVQLGSINNTSGANGGYGNFTNLSTTLTKGVASTITITAGWRSTKYREAYDVWIDYNQDGDFNDAGEKVFTRARTTSTSVSGSFTVPTTALVGSTRMRVTMKYNANATSCETFADGEVEDYTIVIASANNINPAPIDTNETTENARVDGNGLKDGDVAFVAFPNPASQTLNVRLGYFVTNSQIVIYNVTGAQVVKTILTSQETAIDVSKLPKGMYILSINNGREIETMKFIKE
jgi:hypothetical protein